MLAERRSESRSSAIAIPSASAVSVPPSASPLLLRLDGSRRPIFLASPTFFASPRARGYTL